MNNKKISVITVVKNGMPFLKKAVKSFKLQDYLNKELIIIYSNSDDDTENYVKSLKDKNIIVQQDEKSSTRYGSIINGINISNGEIFGLLHSDDIFHNEKVLSQIEREFNSEYDCIYGNILFCDKKNINSINRKWISSKFNIEQLKFGWTPPHTSIFLKKNYFTKNSDIYNEKFKISGDYYFILKLFNDKNLKIKYLNIFITIMRTGGDSTKLNNVLEKFKEDLNISKLFFKNYFFCVLLKIFRKISQLQVFKKKIYSDYLNKINLN